MQRAILGIAAVYVGVFVLLLVFPAASDDGDEASAELLLGGMFSCAMVLLGFLAAAILGRGALAESLASRPRPRDLGWAVGAGAATLLVNAVLLGLLGMLVDEPFWGGFGVPASWPLVVIGTAVLPAVSEEWLCRGVLWAGLKRVTSERGTLVLTSLLFAMLHGLGEAGLLELPTRFLAGMVFGWLRAKSGSLQPAILAHFVNNLLACFLASG